MENDIIIALQALNDYGIRAEEESKSAKTSDGCDMSEGSADKTASPVTKQ